MRLSTGQLFDRGISGVLRSQSELSDIQQQIQTGKKILKPSDDAVGAANVIRLTEELDQITQFKKNNNLLENSLEQQEAAFTSIKNALNQARVKTVQAGNGILSSEDRAALGKEIEQLEKQVFDLMNSRNADGEYIFAGSRSHEPAYTFNPSAANKYQYQGDETQNRVQISPTVTIESSDTGKEIFEKAFARLNVTQTGVAGGATASIKVSEQAAFDSFHTQQYSATTPANNTLTATVIAPGNQVQIADGTPTVLGTVAYTSGQKFSFNGIEFNMTGGAGAQVSFNLDQPERKNIAQTLYDLRTALSNPNISDRDYDEALSDALVGLDNGLKSLADATSQVGGRLSVAKSVEGGNLDLEIAQKSARANIEEADYSEAISELRKQETALQAAQATFGRVTQLSLFDILR